MIEDQNVRDIARAVAASDGPVTAEEFEKFLTSKNSSAAADTGLAPAGGISPDFFLALFDIATQCWQFVKDNPDLFAVGANITVAATNLRVMLKKNSGITDDEVNEYTRIALIKSAEILKQRAGDKHQA